MNNGKEVLIHQQFEELVQTFPGLALSQDAPGRWVIRGTLSFSATFQTMTIADAFSILIILPDDYPDSPPAVQETGGRIPSNFHQYGDRTLCLGAPVEVIRRFKVDSRLVTFVKTLVVEYLYGFAHFETHGILPFGELSHGCQGIRDYYQDAFSTDNVHITLALLKVLADGTYRGHHLCPCGSGNILRKCHGPILLCLLKHQPKERFLRDATNVLYSLEKFELADFDWGLLPKQLKLEFDEMARKRASQEKCD
ncbi:MAG: SEC-C domain-containing protein [Desulfobacteraceae bacterium]|nr:MAG: SEC-C domain-containing protein [Desulfobacteraceae bacterium]